MSGSGLSCVTIVLYLFYTFHFSEKMTTPPPQKKGLIHWISDLSAYSSLPHMWVWYVYLFTCSAQFTPPSTQSHFLPITLFISFTSRRQSKNFPPWLFLSPENFQCPTAAALDSNNACYGHLHSCSFSPLQ